MHRKFQAVVSLIPNKYMHYSKRYDLGIILTEYLL